MLQFISKEEYGFYILCVDFLAWVGFLEFGTNKVIESKAAHLIAKQDYVGLNRSFNSSFYFQLFIGVLIIPFYFILINTGMTQVHTNHVNLIIWIFSISAGLSVFRNLFSSVIIASKKVHLDNRIKLVMNILNYVLILSLVPFVGVLGLAIINLIAVILILVRSNYRVKKLYTTFKISSRFFDKEELKNLLADGIYFSLGSLATLILLKIDSFIIGREFGLEEVASFYITIKLFMLAQKVIEVAINNFRPHIAQLYGKNDFHSIKLFYEIVLFSLTCVSVIIVSFILLVNESFIHLWVGSGYYIGDLFSLWFGYYIIINLSTLPSRIVLISSLYEVKRLNVFKIMEGVFRITLIVLLLKSSSILLLPFSSMLAMFIFGVIFFHFQIQKFFQSKSNMKVNTYLPFMLILFCHPFINAYFRLSINYNLIVLIITLLAFFVYMKIKWNDVKKLGSIVFNR